MAIQKISAAIKDRHGPLPGLSLFFRTQRCLLPVVFTLLLGGAAAGCADYTPRPITAQQTLEDFEARRLDAPELGELLRDGIGIGTWPPTRWDLDALTLVAFYYSPDMDVARARWGVAQAGMITAGMRPNPDVAAGIGYNSTSVGITPWIPEAILALTIETAGKRGIRIDESRHISEAARLNVLSTAWSVRSRLRAAYIDLFLARGTGTNLRRERDLRAESVRLLEVQLAAGEISPNEMTQARIALNQTELAVLDAAQRERQAGIRLAAALGVPNAALDGIDFGFADLQQSGPEPPDNEIRRRALTNRSDILGALADYEASQEALRLEIAKQYPDISIAPGFQLDQVDAKWLLGFGFSLPVFHKNEGPIAEAEARREEMAATVLAVQARIISEVEIAVAAYQAAAGKTATTDALVARLQEQETVASSAYRLGEISRLELLSVQLELTAGEQARLEVLGSAQQATSELENAIQSPIDLPDWVLETPVRASAEQGHGR
jgi:outer membrane protein TolC